MIFTQLSFFAFFALTFAVHWLLRSNRARKLWLLAASYFFYGCWDYRFLALIAFSTLFDYGIGVALGQKDDARARKTLITLSICVNLGFLGFFKYYNFFVSSGAQLLHALGVQAATPSLSIVLPVGISFFTFQSMSYTIDVYRRVLPPQRHFTDFALFVSFFPQLVAGPIARAAEFLPQLADTRTLAQIDARRAFLLFLGGYFKKACIADHVALVIDPFFARPSDYHVLDRVLGGTLYSLQIYCDFSGYTDMAIASAALLGYRLSRNFDAPYLSSNVREFWQRWHISLSSWLRDYLYISLGGNRGGELRTARNLLATMVLGGLWHGAQWTFVLWGFLHGLALVIQRAFTRVRAAPRASGASDASGIARVASWALTLAWVVFCFTIFRSASLGTVLELYTGPTAKESHVLPAPWWVLLAVLLAVHFGLHRRRSALIARARALPDFAFYPALGTASAVLLYFTPLNVAPFIYFQF